MSRREKAWAIAISKRAYLGVGWFNWNLRRPGLSTMTFETRQAARAGLNEIRQYYPAARVCRVSIVLRREGE